MYMFLLNVCTSSIVVLCFSFFSFTLPIVIQPVFIKSTIDLYELAVNNLISKSVVTLVSSFYKVP